MNYGLYLSASGALSNMYRQDVAANNLANMNTVGFKPDRVYTRERLPERVENARIADPKWMLERLGGGLFVEPTQTTTAQGDLVQTGRDLDVALRGEGYLALEPNDANGPADARLTRDGRLTLNDQGELISVVGGLRVRDANGGPIRLDAAHPVRIDRAGVVFQQDAAVGQLQLVAADPADLVKLGGNVFKFLTAQTELNAATPDVHQRFTEGSAVNPIMALNTMMNAAKAAQANLTMMQYHDQILGRAFNTFGRVA